MRGRLQRACIAEWRERAGHLVERVLALPDDGPVLHRSPAPGTWSAAQVLEHLVLTGGSYLAVMRQRVEDAGVSADAGARWRPTLAGRMLAWSMTSPRRFPAPRGWVPGPTPRPHVREAVARDLRELDALLERAGGLTWNRLRFGSPAAGLLRLNVGDGFLITIAHAERHLGQIGRALEGARAAGG